MTARESVSAHEPTAVPYPNAWGCGCGEEFCTGLQYVAHVLEADRAAFAPHVARREREAAVLALRDAADSWTQGAWGSTPRRADRVADRMAASQFAGDWLRERAARIERGEVLIS